MKTLLVDSNYLCYRAKLVTGHLEYNGLQTGIAYGFFNQLMTIAKNTNPDNIVFIWDSKKSKRKKLLSTYKEKRRQNQTEEEKKEWEEAFKEFKKLRKEILPEIGFINNFIQVGYESDDLIAQYTFNKKKNEHVIIATSDDDLLQLLQPKVDIYNPGKDTIINVKKFESEKGICPLEWGEVKKLAGCISDNVPGVPGVGEKTAIKFLRGELKETTKAYKAIKENEELVEFNRSLVVLPFEGTKNIIPYVKQNQFDMLQFLRFCREYGLNSFRTEDKKEQIKKLFKSKEISHG